jgi:hypothetical protein
MTGVANRIGASAAFLRVAAVGKYPVPQPGISKKFEYIVPGAA